MLGITGTPGTGKKSVAPLVAEELGVEAHSIGELARANGAAKRSKGEEAVDTEKLARALAPMGRSPDVVYGHLLPHVFDSLSLSDVVVLRCEPAVLKERLRKRGYPLEKVMENVEAELIGVVANTAFEKFGDRKTWELDTTKTSPHEAAKAIVESSRKRTPSGPKIDWTLAYDSARKLKSLLSTP
jgi:adenylate kinase